MPLLETQVVVGAAWHMTRVGRGRHHQQEGGGAEGGVEGERKHEAVQEHLLVASLRAHGCQDPLEGAESSFVVQHLPNNHLTLATTLVVISLHLWHRSLPLTPALSSSALLKEECRNR